MSFRGAWIVLAALQAAPAPQAEPPRSYRSDYFRATKPGAWAKYRLTAAGAPDGFTTYTRLPNQGDQQRLQLRVDFTAEGEKKTGYTDSLLKSGYSLQEDALGFGKAIVSASVWEEGASAEALDEEVLEDMRETTPDFAPTATFVATETVLGKTCDRYKYTQKHPGDPEQIETGDIWLNETVPFGLVRQAGEARDSSGAFLTRFEMNLVDSGTDATAAAPARRRQAVAGPPVKLADAYRDGQAEVSVEVLAGSGNGSRLAVQFKNKSDLAIRLTIPAGPAALEVGGPVETLRFDSPSTWLFDLEPGETSPVVELLQTGARRTISGKFVSSMEGGKPAFSGDATTDTPK